MDKTNCICKSHTNYCTSFYNAFIYGVGALFRQTSQTKNDIGESYLLVLGKALRSKLLRVTQYVTFLFFFFQLQNATSLNSVECGRDSFELNSRGEASTTNRGKSSVRCTHVNELASLAKTRRKLPRQQSTLTPECVKEFTHKRRLSLDPAVTKVELDKVLHPSHQKKAKSSKEKTAKIKG